MSASNPVVWFEIYTDDLARARVFYEAVLDGLAATAAALAMMRGLISKTGR